MFDNFARLKRYFVSEGSVTWSRASPTGRCVPLGTAERYPIGKKTEAS